VSTTTSPKLFRALRGEASEIRQTPYGSVGTLYAGRDIEAVWVAKENEEIDPGWFSQSSVDVLCVLQGQLHVEYADASLPATTLRPGDVLILPPQTRCRAYRVPREATEATVFLAVYPPPTSAAHPGH
jgi:hypothetical protein